MYEKITFESENISTYVSGTTAIVKLKKNIFNEVVEFVNSDRFFNILSEINHNKNIDALLLINEEGTLGCSVYEKFIMDHVAGDRKSRAELRFKSDNVSINRIREINILKRIILKLADFNKIVISGLTGEIVTPFFGLSLSVNFRFATRNMKFSLDHRKFGLHPSGALPYFLKHYVNWSKQNEILYIKEELSAEEALSLGMIDKIFPDGDFENNCIAEINRIIELNIKSLCKTKLLMAYPISELINYFEKESLFI